MLKIVERSYQFEIFWDIPNTSSHFGSGETDHLGNTFGRKEEQGDIQRSWKRQKKRGMARKRRRLAESVEVRDETSRLIGKQGRHLSKTAVWESARRRWCKKALKREWGGSAAKGLDLKFMTLAINGAYPQNQKIRIGTPQYTMNWG